MQPKIKKIRFAKAHPLRCFAEVMATLVVLTIAAVLSPARAAEVAPGVLETAMEGVFTVRSADAADRFLGSAFLWDGGEVVVTNAHVVGDAAEVRLVDRAGREAVAPVIARDAVRDVAVIYVKAGFVASFVAGRVGLVAGPPPALGAAVWALGAPLGLEFTVTQGMVSAQPRQVEVAVPIRMVQHDAAVNPGSSGGPLLDALGRLVGMNSRIADGSRHYIGIAYAITAADLVRIVPALIGETLPAFPTLGLRARAVDRQVAAALGLGANGLLIDHVAVAGLAAAAGLRPGDVILAVDGVVLEAAGEFAFLIEAALDKGAVDLAVLRAGSAVIVTLEFVSRDAAAVTTRSLRDSAGVATAVQRVVSYRLSSMGMMLSEGGMVAKVTENSPAIFAGVAEGDRLIAVNGVKMDLAALRRLVVTEPVLLLLQGRDGTTRHVLVDPWASFTGFRPVGGANVLDPDVVVF